jgi:hypothetical protein
MVALFQNSKKPMVVKSGHGEEMIVKKVLASVEKIDGRIVGNEDFVKARFNVKLDADFVLHENPEFEFSSLTRLKILAHNFHDSITENLQTDKEFLKLFSLEDFEFSDQLFGISDKMLEIQEEIKEECDRHKKCSKRCRLQNFCETYQLKKSDHQ